MELLDLEKVCRGCLGKNGEMRPLYGSCLDKMLMTVAEVQVSKLIIQITNVIARSNNPRYKGTSW